MIFAEKIPPLMSSENIDSDPVKKQFYYSILEEQEDPNFCLDPLQEENFKITENMLHKYHGRALLLTTPNCAMNCRFCFRRHMEIPDKKDFTEEISYISHNTVIKEIILSGGDPLMMNREKLYALIRKFDAIPHLKVIRIHTRAPMGIKNIIDDKLMQILSSISKQVIFVLHINHAEELSCHAIENIEKLKANNILLFSQSVLLKDVNDDIATLQTLFEKLIELHIIPYYLHQLDKISGASHFYVKKEKGIKLYEELRAKISGYCLPRYVEEKPHEKSKTPIYNPKAL